MSMIHHLQVGHRIRGHLNPDKLSQRDDLLQKKTSEAVVVLYHVQDEHCIRIYLIDSKLL
jgi:hypothetical protein